MPKNLVYVCNICIYAIPLAIGHWVNICGCGFNTLLATLACSLWHRHRHRTFGILFYIAKNISFIGKIFFLCKIFTKGLLYYYTCRLTPRYALQFSIGPYAFHFACKKFKDCRFSSVFKYFTM